MIEEKAKKFWISQPSNIFSMILSPEAKELDPLDRMELFFHLPSVRGKRVLDLASGTGRFTTEFAKRKAEKITAVDLSSNFIKENQKNNRLFSNIEYVHCDVRDLEREKGEFDLIFISWLFMYLSDREVKHLIEKLSKWLKPKGSLFFRETVRAKREVFDDCGYFALYRREAEYFELFSSPWKLIHSGHSQAYIDIKADPFKAYWLYELSDSR